MGKALEKDRARRYQSPAAIAEDVKRFMADEPILARRASSLYNFRKWVVRHRNAVVFASLIVFLVIAARSWVRWTEESIQTHADKTNELLGLKDVASSFQMARLAHEVGRWDRAEQEYETALQLLDWLGAERYALRRARIMVDLGTLLTERPAPDDMPRDDDEADYRQAEAYLLAALDVFDANAAVSGVQRRTTLEALRRLYPPDAWDDVDGLKRVETRLGAFDTSEPPSDDALKPGDSEPPDKSVTER